MQILLYNHFKKSIQRSKFIYKPHSEQVVIEMRAAVMEFVFQGNLCIAEKGRGKACHYLIGKMAPLFTKNNTGI